MSVPSAMWQVNLNALFLSRTKVIADTQRGYSVPDVELRESLKRDNKEYILPKVVNLKHR